MIWWLPTLVADTRICLRQQPIQSRSARPLRRRFLRALLVTIEELCAESDVEAAYVATPPVSHP
jgi:hypothetical protein